MSDTHADSVIVSTGKWWHAVFYSVTTVLLGTYALLIPWPGSLGFLIPLLVTVGAYSVLVMPGWPSPAQGQWYVAIMLVCLWVATALAPYTAFMYFYVFVHVWMFAKNAKWAFGNVAAMALGLTAAAYLRLPDLSFNEIAFQILLPSIACLGSGYWIHLIITQSEERADLLAALRDTQTKLAEANRIAGARAERERLSRDIHDTLAQGFTSVILLTDAALAKSARGLDITDTLTSLRRIGQDNLDEARTLVSGGSTQWDDQEFTAALERTCAAQDWLHIESSIAPCPPGLTPQAKIMFLRALQESLNNAKKYARASRVRVNFWEDGAVVHLVIHDDGTGFNSPSSPEYSDGREKFGLYSMRQRAEEVGALLEIDSKPGNGTKVSLQVSLHGSADE